jgi:hypothetical protein
MPLHTLIAFSEEQDRKLNEYSREVQKIASSQAAQKGKIQYCITYPGLVAHGG